jgi:hypothetical protein
MQNLLTLLQSTGVHTADNWVSLVELNGISANGTIMAEYGQSPRSKDLPFETWEPFRVVLPVP